MSQGWVPVRMIRWPAQQQDRARCAERGIPHVVLVETGSEPPALLPGSVVLFEPVTELALQRAVDDLAWGGPVARTTQFPPWVPYSSPKRRRTTRSALWPSSRALNRSTQRA